MRKRTEEKRQEILSAAQKAFSEHGFDGTSMDVISKRLGFSKATLYGYFSSKEELFFEVMQTYSLEIFSEIRSLLNNEEPDIRKSLYVFSEKLLGLLYTNEIISHRRLAICESGRVKIGKELYMKAYCANQVKMNDFFQIAIEQGKIKKSDPKVVAYHFRGLIEAELLIPSLLRSIDIPCEEELKIISKRAVDVFLDAYGVR